MGFFVKFGAKPFYNENTLHFVGHDGGPLEAGIQQVAAQCTNSSALNVSLAPGQTQSTISCG